MQAPHQFLHFCQNLAKDLTVSTLGCFAIDDVIDGCKDHDDCRSNGELMTTDDAPSLLLELNIILS
jgi:hypothetical protein